MSETTKAEETIKNIAEELVKFIDETMNSRVPSEYNRENLETIKTCYNAAREAIRNPSGYSIGAIDDLIEIAKSNLIDGLKATHSKNEARRIERRINSIKSKLHQESNAGINTQTIEASEIKTLLKLFNEQRVGIIKETEKLQQRISNLENELKEKTKTIDDAAKKAEIEINGLVKNIQHIASIKSGDLVYGSYKESAATEMLLSDKFRNYSAILMIAAVLMAAYYLFKSSSETINSLQIAMRASTFILLSIPAAYFARESSKHRRQQYLYQQYSLNLNALNPFIAELEVSEKNSIKGELAKIIFTASHEKNSTKEEGHPINAQELISLLINKIDTSNRAK